MPRPRTSTDLLAYFWQHPVTVERRVGTSAYGEQYAEPENLTGLVDDSNHLVIDAKGQQVVSSARVYLPPETADVPIKSRVTLNGPFLGRQAQVIVAIRKDAGVIPMPDHLELTLQ